MPYATTDDVMNRYKPIRTLFGSNSTDVSTVEVASVYVWAAQGLVDGYLGLRYQVPLTSVPPLVTQITADLSIHSILAEKLAEIPEFMDKRYDRCIKLLEQLRDGQLILTSASVISSGGDNEAWSASMDYHSVFSPVLGDLEQVADQDRIDEHKTERVGDTGFSEDI